MTSIEINLEIIPLFEKQTFINFSFSTLNNSFADDSLSTTLGGLIFAADSELLSATYVRRQAVAQEELVDFRSLIMLKCLTVANEIMQ